MSTERASGPNDTRGRFNDPGFGERPEMGLVSVVVPTYGREPAFLAESIASVAAQTYDRVELVVVDDSPPGTDLGEQVFGRDPSTGGVDVDAFEQVGWIREGKHNSAGAARNTGIRAANGEFVAVLDDDDVWHRTKLARQLATLRDAGGDVGLVYCSQRYVDANGNPIGADRRSARGDVLGDLFTGRPLAPFSAAVVRAEAINEVGLIDERFPVLEDREWYLRIAARFRVEVVPAPLVDRRVDNYDRLTADWEAYHETVYPLMLEKHRALAAETGHERAFVAWLSRTVGAVGVGTGHARAAREYLLRSLRADPFAPKTYAYLLLNLGGDRLRGPLRGVRRAVGRLLGSRS